MKTTGEDIYINKYTLEQLKEIQLLEPGNDEINWCINNYDSYQKKLLKTFQHHYETEAKSFDAWLLNQVISSLMNNAVWEIVNKETNNDNNI